MNSFLQIFIQVVLTIIRLVLIAGLGSLLTYLNIMTKDFKGILAAIIFNVFLPCFLISKILFTVKLDDLLITLIILLYFLIMTVISALCGYALVKLLKVQDRLQRVLIMAITFQNAGTLPLVVADVAPLGLDSNNDLAISYISIYMSLVSATFWTVGYSYLHNVQKDDDSVQVELKPLEGNKKLKNSDDQEKEKEEEPIVELLEEEDDHHSLKTNREFAESQEKEIEASSQSSLHPLLLPLRKFNVANFKKFVPPTLIAMVIGYFLALIPVFQKPLTDKDSVFYTLFTDVITTIGAPAIVLSLLILGSNLVSMSRVILPAISYGLSWCFSAAGLIKSDTNEGRVLQFVLILENSSPTAINLSLITQLYQVGVKEISLIQFWMYMCCLVTLTGIMSVSIWHLDFHADSALST